MIFFKRQIEEKIKRLLFTRNLITILGPRQSGKTTLAKKIVSEFGSEGQYYDCQILDVRKCFVVGEPAKLLPLTSGKKVVVFDEAQTIQDIGSILKLFHDTYKDVQIIATGSSSFDLSNKIVEPMTGRAIEFTLLPLSMDEVKSVKKIDETEFYSLLQYGSYPAVVAAEGKESKEIEIKKIATNYLYKDVFIFESIRNPKTFEDLLKLLALQLGQLVSVNELAESLKVSRTLINKYLRLLEQTFIIKRIYSFSTNPRLEIKKAFKVYFLDLGVRNAIVDILTPINDRKDKGGIFENFYFTELAKKNTLDTFGSEVTFWRTRAGMEIDFVEKLGTALKATECKWSREGVRFTKFLEKYPEAKVSEANVADYF